MRKPFKANLPCGEKLVSQLSIGLDTIQENDYYLVCGHLKGNWYPAEKHSIGKKLKEYHFSHVRIIN